MAHLSYGLDAGVAADVSFAAFFVLFWWWGWGVVRRGREGDAVRSNEGKGKRLTEAVGHERHGDGYVGD